MSTKSKAGYVVVIKTQPGRGYQTYQGWDQVYTSRPEAVAARNRARKLWSDARVIRASA